MTLFETLRRIAERRAHYRRTLRALRSLPAAVARDLAIDRDAAERLARHAVYGA